MVDEQMSREDYNSRFEVVLAAPYERCETNGERFDFYGQIADSLIDLRKRLFLPHKEIKRNLTKEELFQETYGKMLEGGKCFKWFSY